MYNSCKADHGCADDVTGKKGPNRQKWFFAVCLKMSIVTAVLVVIQLA